MTARTTFTFVPDVADLVARHAPDTLVLAAGGVADGRGLAAALALGADGVLVGTRLWAAPEALVTAQAQQRAVGASGDDTVRTQVYDIVRQRDWPEQYDARLVINPLIRTWHGNEAELLTQLPDVVNTFTKAAAEQDFDIVTPLVGEAISLIHDVRPAEDIVREMAADAARILNRG